MNRPLPPGWSWAVPDDVATRTAHALAIGPFGSNLKVSDYKSSGVPLVFVRHIRAERFDADTHFVSETKAEELSPHSVTGGNVLITKMGEPPGDSAIYPLHLPDAIITADCIKWSIDPRVGEPKFFMYAIRTSELRQEIIAVTKGVAQNKVSLGRFRTITLPCAPRDEQTRVVDAVDSHLSRLDKAVASLERVQAELKPYRASVLKAAAEGRLVPTEASLARAEKRNYEPAEVLLARILKERRCRWEEAELAKLTVKGSEPNDDRWKARYEKPIAPEISKLPELSEGWCWASVDQLGLVSGGLTQNAKRKKYKAQLPFLRVANVYANALVLDEIKMIGVEAGEIERVRLLSEDLLVVEGNGSVDQIGRVALWDGSIEPILHQNHLIKVRFEPRQLSKWVLIWLLSPAGRSAIETVASSTSGLHTLSISKVARLAVPLPPLAEQTRAFDEVDAKLSLIDATVDNLSRDLRRCSRLRQAVLKWAFEGKLVDQDPSDEPADKLLARIRAEGAVVGPTKKSGGRKAKGAA